MGGEPENHMVDLFLGVELTMLDIRVKKIFNKLTCAEDYTCGFIIGDVEEREKFSGGGVAGVVDDRDGEAFGGFIICPYGD